MKRLLAISDIHGHYDAFIRLMALVQYNPKQDDLIVLGDLIDRGTKSSQVVKWFLPGNPGERAIVLRGNHEEALLKFLKGQLSHSTYVNVYMGGIQTIKSYESVSEKEMIQHLSFLDKLPLYHQQDGFIFAHAGINTHQSIQYQSAEDLLYDRLEFFKQGNLSKYPSDIVVFGHTPTGIIRDQLKQSDIGSYIWYDKRYGNKIGIDCGNQRQKRLACLDLTNCIEYYQSLSKKGETEVRASMETIKMK